MSHGGDGDLEAQAWPGFVDILSSTMIMFVFFLMITATALFFHTIMFKSKLLSHNEEVVTDRVNKKVKDLVQENKQLKEKIEEMKQNASAGGDIEQQQKIKLLQQATEFADSVEQEVKIAENEKEITVLFGADAISLTKDTNETIVAFLKKFAGQNVRFVVTAGKESDERMALTARKVSVARMLNVRNQLIQAKIDPNHITATIVEDNDVSGKGDWVKITVEQK